MRRRGSYCGRVDLGSRYREEQSDEAIQCLRFVAFWIASLTLAMTLRTTSFHWLHFDCKIPIQFLNSRLRPSLRANGSRECAPDDRLREAIHRGRHKT